MESLCDIGTLKPYVCPDEQPSAVYTFDPVSQGITFVNVPGVADMYGGYELVCDLGNAKKKVGAEQR